jgi:predicted dienelactone hydrolase
VLPIGVLSAGCSDDGGGDEATESSTSGTTADGTDSSTGDEETTGQETSGGDGDGADTSDTSGTGSGDAMGCDGVPLLERDMDPSADGPWDVGARTVQVNGFNVEVWYPSTGATGDPKVYDIREQLPPSQQDVIPDEDNPWQECDCYADLEIDAANGPYPLVVFIHGTAGYRTQSLTQMTHWASRGFVVAAADYEGLRLAHMLAILCPDDGGTQNLSGDTDAIIAAIGEAGGDLAFLEGRVDMTRVAIAGHSAGGGAAAGSADKAGVRVVIPMASTDPAVASSTLESTLFMGATADGVVDYSGTQNGYEANVAPKRLVGIENGGHLAFSNLCGMENSSGQDFVEIADQYGICGAAAAGFLFDCADTLLPEADAMPIVNYATTAVLEEVLHCREDGVDLSQIESVFSDVGEYRQEL